MENTSKKTKQYFMVKLETTMPVICTYRVFAHDAEEALELARQQKAPLSEPIRPHFAKMRIFVAKVSKFGSNMIELMRKF